MIGNDTLEAAKGRQMPVERGTIRIKNLDGGLAPKASCLDLELIQP